MQEQIDLVQAGVDVLCDMVQRRDWSNLSAVVGWLVFGVASARYFLRAGSTVLVAVLSSMWKSIRLASRGLRATHAFLYPPPPPPSSLCLKLRDMIASRESSWDEVSKIFVCGDLRAECTDFGIVHSVTMLDKDLLTHSHPAYLNDDDKERIKKEIRDRVELHRQAARTSDILQMLDSAETTPVGEAIRRAAEKCSSRMKSELTNGVI